MKSTINDNTSSIQLLKTVFSMCSLCYHCIRELSKHMNRLKYIYTFSFIKFLNGYNISFQIVVNGYGSNGKYPDGKFARFDDSNIIAYTLSLSISMKQKCIVCLGWTGHVCLASNK